MKSALVLERMVGSTRCWRFNCHFHFSSRRGNRYQILQHPESIQVKHWPRRKPKKSLGQHFLASKKVIDQIVESAEISQTDHVLEVGAGTGNLTKAILEKKPEKLTAFELDGELASALRETATKWQSGSVLEVVECDALIHPFPYVDICLSNVPYFLSKKLTKKFLRQIYNQNVLSENSSPDGKKRKHMRCLILLFQKEFAEKLLAQPGEKQYGALSVACQSLAQVNQIMSVSANQFTPSPKVNSSLLKLSPLKDPMISLVEWDAFFEFLTICFQRKQRKLRSNLSTKAFFQFFENHIQRTDNGRYFEHLNFVLKETDNIGQLTSNSILPNDFCKLYSNLFVLGKET